MCLEILQTIFEKNNNTLLSHKAFEDIIKDNLFESLI